jgi:two-component system chemotaxis sensor kinase CheA
MADLSSDIVADFIAESGEIVDRLGEQLVELEQRPTDTDLLNAIFRGFHTVKGGAGFLRIGAVVILCHAAEEVFDQLRAGKLVVDGELFDQVLEALDSLQDMMQSLRAGVEPGPAPAALIEALGRAAGCGGANVHEPKPVAETAGPPGAGDAIDDGEFEALLDALHGKGGAPGKHAESIDDTELEALLDALHGKGVAHGAPPPAPALPRAITSPAPKRAAPQREAQESTVRVETRRLDAMMNLVGELVLARNRLKNVRNRSHNVRRRASDAELDRAIGTLDRLTGRLQSAVMRTRMQPVGRVFSRFPKLARDVARTLAKEVRLELIGEETELDKNMVEALADPLVHLVRNAIDHGIEAPAVREQRGKPRQGTVVLAAQHEGDHMLITVRDDGAGMDPELLRNKAREKGLLSAEAAARLTPDECFNLIFMPGFSTKSEVSEISGRGVGMDVVKSKLIELNGQVSIESKRGEGTTIAIKLPLTLAILTTLLVQVAGRPYAVPLTNVDQVFRFEREKRLWIDGRETLDVHGSTLPLLYLKRWLGLEGSLDEGCVVVVRSGDVRYGLVVDVVRGRDEVVIKPLPRAMRDLVGFAGATISGDGAIALILDADGIFRARERAARA